MVLVRDYDAANARIIVAHAILFGLTRIQQAGFLLVKKLQLEFYLVLDFIVSLGLPQIDILPLGNKNITVICVNSIDDQALNYDSRLLKFRVSSPI